MGQGTPTASWVSGQWSEVMDTGSTICSMTTFGFNSLSRLFEMT